MKALLLIGSPKGKAGTSYVLGEALMRRLEARGAEVEEMTVTEAILSAEDRDRLPEAFDTADVIVVSFPLYVDQLPAPLIQALEHVADRRRRLPGVTPGTSPLAARIVAVVQCGFPETFQNGSAVDIVRRFAEESGFRWAGALAMGSGGAVGGRNLEKAGGMLRGIVQALDLAAASLAEGGVVPEKATALMAKPLMPRWLYHPAANWGFRQLLKKHGAKARTYDRPYA